MKDPAVLFYTDDFLSGTFTMSNEHCGMYIRLLCLQHQKGKLTEKDMLSICKTYVIDVFEKFEIIDGFYLNKRMRIESEKRSKFTASRRSNALAKHMHKHMGNGNGNGNINENRIKKDKEVKEEKKKMTIPTLDEVKQHILETGSKVDAVKFWNYYDSIGWKVGKNQMKNWKSAVATWNKNSNDEQKYSPSNTRVMHY